MKEFKIEQIFISELTIKLLKRARNLNYKLSILEKNKNKNKVLTFLFEI